MGPGTARRAFAPRRHAPATPSVARATRPAQVARPGTSAAGAADLLGLQRLAGNRAVSDLLTAAVPLVQRMNEETEQGIETEIKKEGEEEDAGPELAARRFAGNDALTKVLRGQSTLAEGASGEAVTAVQQFLHDLGIVRPALTVSGTFDEATTAAVIAYQAEATLTRHDGVVDHETMRSLDFRGRVIGGPGAAIDTVSADPYEGSDDLIVTVPGKISAATTPLGMSEHRIPPRVDTPVRVEVSGLRAESAAVTLSVEGDASTSGSATVNGSASADVRATAVVQLRGVTQSSLDNELRLVARQHGQKIASSRPFTVAAVPQYYSTAFVTDVNDEYVGVIVQDAWESDSGVIDDLVMCKIDEQVEITKATGCFENRSLSAGKPELAIGSVRDHHTVLRDILTRHGTASVQQTHVFSDSRTEARDIPIRSSGYEIDHELVKDEKGWKLVVDKHPKSTSARGSAAGAGAGGTKRELRLG